MCWSRRCGSAENSQWLRLRISARASAYEQQMAEDKRGVTAQDTANEVTQRIEARTVGAKHSIGGMCGLASNGSRIANPLVFSRVHTEKALAQCLIAHVGRYLDGARGKLMRLVRPVCSTHLRFARCVRAGKCIPIVAVWRGGWNTRIWTHLHSITAACSEFFLLEESGEMQDFSTRLFELVRMDTAN